MHALTVDGRSKLKEAFGTQWMDVGGGISTHAGRLEGGKCQFAVEFLEGSRCKVE